MAKQEKTYQSGVDEMQWAAMMIMIMIMIRYGCVSVMLQKFQNISQGDNAKRDRQTDRHRQTDTQADRQTDTDRQTHRQTDTQTDTHIGRQTHTQTDRQTCRQTDRQTHTQSDDCYGYETNQSNLCVHIVQAKEQQWGRKHWMTGCPSEK